jgi:membrane protein
MERWTRAAGRFVLGWLIHPPSPVRLPKALSETSLVAVRANWGAVLGQTLLRFGRNQIPLVSAGVTFFLLLALFPAVNAALSIFSLFGYGDQAHSPLSALEFILPAGGADVINQAVQRVSSSGAPVRHIALVVSTLLWLWSANAGVKAFFTGLNITYGAAEIRSFLVLNLMSLAFTAGGALTVAAAMVSLAAAPAVLARYHLAAAPWVAILRWPILLAVTALVLWLFYRFGAGRAGERLRTLLPGAIVSAVIWIAGSAAFAAYVSAFGHFNRTYGSLGAVVGFMTWIWLSVMVAFLGAELNSTLSRALEDKAGPAEP